LNCKIFFLLVFIISAVAHSQWVDVDEVIKKQKEEREKTKKLYQPKFLVKTDSNSIYQASTKGIDESLKAIKKYNDEIRKTCFKKKDKDVDVKACHQDIAASLLAINYLKSFISDKVGSLIAKEKSSIEFDSTVNETILKNELKEVTDKDLQKLLTTINKKPTIYGELKNTLAELKVNTNDSLAMNADLKFSSRYSGDRIVSIDEFSKVEKDKELQDTNKEQVDTYLVDYQQVISDLANQNISFIQQSSVEGLSRNVASEKIGVAKDSLFRQQSAKFFELTQKGYFLKP